MRTKITLALLFINAALFAFIFYFEREWRQLERVQETRLRVLDASATDIRRLEIAGLPEPIVLERRGEDWFIAAPFVWPANPHAVKRILNELVFLEREASFTRAELERNGATLADYGLDKPALTLAFTPAGAETSGASPAPVTLRIGAETKTGNRLYVLSPDGERVLVVKRSLADSLRVTLDSLRSETLFTIPIFEVRSFSVQAAAANNLRVRVRREGTRWSLETPILARASRTATELALNALSTLTAASFPPPASADPARTGLATPALRLTLEGNGRRETLLVGAATEPASTPATGERTYFAKLEDREAIFTTSLPTALIETLVRAQENLRDRRVLDLEGRIVSSLTLRAPGQPELTLQRLEGSSSGTESANWQIVRRDATPGGSTTLPADPAAVNRLLQHLTLLEAEEFRSDAPSAADLENWGFNRPEREITLVASGPGTAAPGSPAAPAVVLQLGMAAENGGTVHAKLASQDFIYRVPSSILNETPVTPRVFRDRKLRELPTGAQITGLSLVRLADNSSVWTRALESGQSWSEALTREDAKRRGAVETILSELRQLKAQSIVATEFTPTPLVDGEERPWVYRLNATVALGAGAGVQTATYTLLLSERTGGGAQLAGAEDLNVVFLTETSLMDALWTLLYGDRDPGAPVAPAPSAATPRSP